MDKTYLGIEIGGTKLQLVRGDENGAILQRWRRSVDRARGGAGIREQIEVALTEILATDAPRSIGVGFGGPVDWRTGKICCSHQIEGWSEFGLGEWLRRLTALPVRVDNDANTATLGEARHGAGQGFDPVFYVTLGSGVGGGLVVDGSIYHGATPGEAEMGHLRLDRDGTIVEKRCSGWAVDAKIRASLEKEPAGILGQRVGGVRGGEAKHLRAALDEGDRAAQTILDETAGELAFALSHVVHLFHPEIIVIGGGLSLVGEPLRKAIAQNLGRFIMEAFAPGPQVRLAALGEDAVPVGALELARQLAASI